MNSDLLLGLFFGIISVLVITLIILGQSPIVSSKYYNDLKKYGGKIANAKTLYKTGVGLVDPTYDNTKLGWHRTTRYTTVYIKKEGLLIKHLFTRIGIKYDQIISIDVGEKNTAIAFPMKITIKFKVKQLNHRMIFQTERNYKLVDVLKRVLPEQVIYIE